ncbi:MAG: PAS domain S-box protein [Rhodothermales bacterium]
MASQASELRIDRQDDLSNETAEWFDRLFHNALDARLRLDGEGLIVDLNTACASLLGFERKELIGRHLCDLCLDEDAQRLTEASMAMLSQPTYRRSCRFSDKHGHDVPVEVTTYRVEGEQVVWILVELRDIRGKRDLAQELLESRMLFGDAQKLARIGSWRFFTEDNRLIWSDEVFRIAGFDPAAGEPTIEDFMQRIHPEDAEQFLAAIERALQVGEPYALKHRLLLPDGSLRWVVSSGSALFDEHGQLTKLIGTIQDISEQEEAIHATYSSEQRLRFHIEQSPMAYIEWDTNFEVVEWNPAAERIFGYTRAEALGPIPDIVPESEKEKVGALVGALLKGEGGAYSVNKNQTKQGKFITCEWYNTSLRSANGEIVGVSSIVQDITQRIDAEKALMDYARELKQARDLAESATRAKSAFLANMSHEIRTPLNGVIGMASLLKETDLTSEQRDFVQTIQVSSESLLAIINDILDFSKIEAGKIELERLSVCLHDLVEGSLDLLATRAAEHGIELLYEIDESVPPRVFTDPTRLRQILVNLLSNAVKFTEQGEIEVHVDSKPIAGERYEIHMSVRDTGIGIPKEKLNRLFRSFSQVDASTTRKYGGTGLGLSISYKLAELMGGTMWVESTVGVGTTFHCTFEAEPAEPGPDDIPPVFPVAHRVLFVDAHPRGRDILTRRLDGMNLWVDACSDETEAVRHIGEVHYDVVILGLRDEASFEMLTAALATSRGRIPLLATQCMSESVTCRQVPADAYIHRPVRKRGLFEKLQDVLAARPVEEPVGSWTAPMQAFVAEKHPVHQRLMAKMLSDMGCDVEMGAPAGALDAVRAGKPALVLLGLDEIENALASAPETRFDRGAVRVVALATQLDVARRAKLVARGVADVLQMPIQLASLQRLVRRHAGLGVAPVVE